MHPVDFKFITRYVHGLRDCTEHGSVPLHPRVVGHFFGRPVGDRARWLAERINKSTRCSFL